MWKTEPLLRWRQSLTLSQGHLPVTHVDPLVSTNGQREGGNISSTKNICYIGPHELLDEWIHYFTARASASAIQRHLLRDSDNTPYYITQVLENKQFKSNACTRQSQVHASLAMSVSQRVNDVVYSQCVTLSTITAFLESNSTSLPARKSELGITPK